MSERLIELMARAICEDRVIVKDWRHFLPHARAALAASGYRGDGGGAGDADAGNVQGGCAGHIVRDA